MTDPVSIAIAKAAPAVIKVAMPKLLSFIGGEFKDMSVDIHHAIFNAFRQYTESVYEKHLYFSSLVFPNQQLRLKDFYLPLTLSSQEGAVVRQTIIKDFPFDLLNEKKDILIVDQAGMGKSTLLKFMFLISVEKDLGIPIFLELRKLKPTESILDYLFNQLKTLDGSLDQSLVVRLLESGKFIFFLDGFDEVADSDREGVTEKLKDIKRRANKNRFIVTSRDQVGLAALSDFFRVTIRPLTFPEAIALIGKYSSGSALGQSLVEKLESPENRPIHEFLTNPLLVSLLFKAYEHKHTIPLKKHIFYRQVFDALFENHDLSKDAGELNRKKLTGLDIYSFDKVMRAIGFLSLESGRVEYPKDDFLRLIEAAKKLTVGIDFNPQAMLQDLVTRVPLFVVDGNYYRWNHKSIQEYFAALYLSEESTERKKSILVAMFSSARATSYINFFSLYSDVDAKGFRQYFLPELINEFLAEFASFPVLKEIQPQSQAIRRGLIAFRNMVVVNLPKEEFFNRLKPLNPQRPELGAELEIDVFEKSKEVLRAANVKFRDGEAHYAQTNPMVVVFMESRYAFAIQTVRLFPGSVGSLKPQESKTTTMDLYGGSEILPFGMTAITQDASSPLNKPEIFDEVNKLLARSGVNIQFDQANAKTMLREIEAELGAQSSQIFTF